MAAPAKKKTVVKKTTAAKKAPAEKKTSAGKRANASKKKEEMLYDLADLFKVFGDSTRIRILYALMNGPLCVGDLSSELEMNQSAVSHQLKILKQAKLISGSRDGKQIVYSLADEHVRSIINIGLEHIEED